jgi:predicted amidohydrolase
MKSLFIASTQYGLSEIASEAIFWSGITSKISEAAEQGANLIIFPEYVTAHLLSLEKLKTHKESYGYLDEYTGKYVDFFQRSSREWNMIILGGTHICKEENGFVNKAFLFFPDGRIETQNKLHLTPEEKKYGSLIEGDELHIFDSEWGKIAILTCYDIEFPELARFAADRGVELILCPSYTDAASGYHRIRHCCQARAIENQLFVALSGVVGTLAEGRPQLDQGYCQAGVFSPCDIPFSDDGVVLLGELNRDMVIVAEIDFAKLRENRVHGVVSPFYDRRPALYEKESRRRFNKVKL